MDTVTLGKTGITTNKNAFGVLPLQRVTLEEAVAILRAAYAGGITYFDTARMYTDSEQKIGVAFADRLTSDRASIFIATKTMYRYPDVRTHVADAAPRADADVAR